MLPIFFPTTVFMSYKGEPRKVKNVDASLDPPPAVCSFQMIATANSLHNAILYVIFTEFTAPNETFSAFLDFQNISKAINSFINNIT